MTQRRTRRGVVNRLEVKRIEHQRLQSQFGATPVTAFSVVPDGVAGAEADPLGDGAILTLLLRQNLLHFERFVGRHFLCA